MGKGKPRDHSKPAGDRTQGDLGNFVTRSSAAYQSQRASKMAAAPPSPARSAHADAEQVLSRGRSVSLTDLEPPLYHPHSPQSLSQASLCSGDGWDMESQMRSMHAYLRSLPTKTDFEHYVSRMEKSYRKEIAELKRDLGTRMEDVENTTDGMCNTLQSHEEILNTHTNILQQLMYHQDDIENRSRRNNIRIRGIPETIDHNDLHGAVTAIFNQILQQPKDTPIELDRVHRTSGPRSSDSSFVRDTLCRVHFYKVKEEIMKAASTQDSIRLNDTPVMLLPDLSRQTLAMRRALKPITSVLQERKIKYQWRFPFQLRVHHEGKTALFRTLGDLPRFLSTLELPQISLPDWPLPSATPGLPFHTQWQKASKNKRPRSSPQKSPDG